MEIKPTPDSKEREGILKPKTPKKSFMMDNLPQIRPSTYGTSFKERDTHLDDILEEEDAPDETGGVGGDDGEDEDDDVPEEGEVHVSFRAKRKKSLSKKRIKDIDPKGGRRRKRIENTPRHAKDDDEMSYSSVRTLGKTPNNRYKLTTPIKGGALNEDAPMTEGVPLDETVFEKHNKETTRRYLYMILEGGWAPWDQICNQFILFCVFLNIFCFIVLTEKKLKEFGGIYITILILEGFTFGVFTLEYILRVYVSIERKSLRRIGRWLGRLKYCVRPMPAMDLLAILPYPVVHIVHAIHPEIGEGASSILRVFGVLRLFKLEKYTHMGTALYEVIRYNREVLTMTGTMGFILLIMTSTLLYYTEKDANPEYFPSILGTMYTAIMMLCGQGQPWDVDKQLTRMGYFLTALTTAFSVGVFALPAGIIGSGFGLINEHIIKKRMKLENLYAGSESDTTDEDEDEDGEDEKSYMFFTDSHVSDQERKPKKGAKFVDSCPHCTRQLTLQHNKIQREETTLLDMKLPHLNVPDKK